MGDYTRRTRCWLDEYFAQRGEDGAPIAHQPLLGLGERSIGPGALPDLARLWHVLRRLERIEFATLLDVGGAEGFTAKVAQALFGCEVLVGDISVEVGRRGWELCGLQSVALDASRLPFADDSFDVVVCSEVLEHVEVPIEAVLELERVARTALILTTEECHDDSAALEQLRFERSGYPHDERNFLLPEDLRLLLGEGVELSSQFTGDHPVLVPPSDEPRAWLSQRGRPTGLVADGLGVVAWKLLDPGRSRAPRRSDEELLEALLATPARESVRPSPPHGTIAPLLLRTAACPVDGDPLDRRGDALVARRSGRRYAIVDGVPDLIAADAADPTRAQTQARLERAWKGDPRRIESALSLRDALEIPDAGAATGWDFRQRAARRGWHPSQALVPVDGEELGFHRRSSDPAPSLTSPRLDLEPRVHVTCEMELAVRLDGRVDQPTVGQLYWMGAQDFGFGEQRSLTFPVRADGKRRTVTVDLGRIGAWRSAERIAQVRLDPMPGPGEVELRALRMLPAEESVVQGPPSSWRLDRQSDREPWFVGEDLQLREGVGGAFRWTNTGADPMVIGPGPDRAARELSCAHIELRVHNPDYGLDAGQGQLYWWAAGEGGFAEERCISFALRNDGQVHTYRLEFAKHPAWPPRGRILWWRLDPVNGPAEVELLSLILD